MPYNFKDPRFLFLLENVPVPPEVQNPKRTPIVLTAGLKTFGQFYRRSHLVCPHMLSRHSSLDAPSRRTRRPTTAFSFRRRNAHDCRRQCQRQKPRVARKRGPIVKVRFKLLLLCVLTIAPWHRRQDPIHVHGAHMARESTFQPRTCALADKLSGGTGVATRGRSDRVGGWISSQLEKADFARGCG
jgi:hypothetical protein